MGNGYLYSLLDHKMSGKLSQYLTKAVKEGKSVRAISKELYDLHGETVSKSVVHNWLHKTKGA